MTTIEADYLIVGAGASGMAIADELVTRSDASIVLVDHRHQPGGHWNDAYPFVRLHQPSAYYGVDSRTLGNDRIDTHGINAGLYERATAHEICDYYLRVLNEQLLPSGQVTFLGRSCYRGTAGDEHVVMSDLTGTHTRVRVRRRVVDATYVESVVPSRHTPSFAVDPDARFVTPNALVHLDDPATGFTIIGGGKTAMDVATWLIEQHVDPDAIRWIRPRDSWLVDRNGTQPLDLIAGMMQYQAATVAAAAAAASGVDFAHRLEHEGHFHRLDPTHEAEIYRGATISQAELHMLRTIENVVRGVRVRTIGTERIQLTDGALPTDRRQVNIDCTAQGLATSTPQPIFAGDRITVQFTTMGVAPWSAAILGFVETLDVDDAERNRLCPVVPRTGLIADQLRIAAAGIGAELVRREDTTIGAWSAAARLNPARAMADHMDDPELQASLGRMMGQMEAAIENLRRFY